MFTISNTDETWFEYLKLNELNSFVNFWTPTPWNVKTVKKGSRFYFMLKSPIRKIGGFGEFYEYKNLSVEKAWIEFGYRNGKNNKEEFISSIQKYIDKNSTKFGGKEIDVLTYEIGCIVLNNCEYWDKDKYIDLADSNINFPTTIVKYKCFDEYDYLKISSSETLEFQIVNEERQNLNKVLVNSRKGQGTFKGKVLRAYDNKCCVTGETIPELLEAAHIQEYRSQSSNHIRNGLLLRVDIHRLYDNGLIYIDKDYIIHVSHKITDTPYYQFNGKMISLPIDSYDYPSKEALELKKQNFRI